MKIDIVSYSDGLGGAARASYRLQKSLRYNDDLDVEVKMLVKHKTHDDYNVIKISSKFQRFLNFAIEYVSDKFQSLQKTKNKTLHSNGFFGSAIFDMIKKSDADILNLHWFNYDTLSIKQVSKIDKPIVMTLHDMWAFCGSEHYCVDNDNSRFRVGYSNDNKEDIISGVDLNRLIWNQKKKYWKKSFTIVTPSNWLSECARNSALFRAWPIHTIPNALDTNVYKPLDKKIAREFLNLPQDRLLIGFGAIGGGNDPRKGFDLLQSALVEISSKVDNVDCVICGQSKPESIDKVGLPLHYLGHLNDDVTMALFYNAIDVMVVPSRMENLPQTATEPQACGTPVVAFDVAGFPDAIEHKVTGYLAKPFDTNDLAVGIKWVVENPTSIDFFNNTRKRAIDLWSEKVVAKQYASLFQEVLEPEYDQRI